MAEPATTNYPEAQDTVATLMSLGNQLSATLSGAHTSVVTTITVVSTASWPSSGYLLIDSEIVHYTGLTGTTFTDCTRGADGTTGVSHSDGVTVYQVYNANLHNQMRRAMLAVEQWLTDAHILKWLGW